MAKKSASRKPSPQVAIIMGSDSDLEAMTPCMKTLEELGVRHQVTVASAHRTPAHLEQTVKKFESGGGKVVIAAAGGAAHLPGVVASLTPLPVIGVPIRSPMLGLDSLLSIVQMPGGVPVATVGVNGSKNAALLATQILATGSKALMNKLVAFRSTQAEKVIEKSRRLSRVGYENYSK